MENHAKHSGKSGVQYLLEVEAFGGGRAGEPFAGVPPYYGLQYNRLHYSDMFAWPSGSLQPEQVKWAVDRMTPAKIM